jgi:hypothetical protein
MIPAMGAFYIAFTYAFSGAASSAGVAAAFAEGRDNRRKLLVFVANLQE